MKRLTCEMCGSTDIIKQDGVFVCEVCGVKYSVEEARKMLVEGTVEIQGTVAVQGTVQVDNASYVQRYLQNARRAKAKEDWEEVEKYYNLVEQNEPDNIEAIFYSAYGKAKRALVPSDIYQRKEAFKVLNNSVSIIDDHYNPEKKEEHEEAIRSMTADVIKMLSSDFVYNYKKDGYGITTWSDKVETYQLFLNFTQAYIESIENIIQKDDHLYLHEELRNLYYTIMSLTWITDGTRECYGSLLKKKTFEIEERKKRAYWETHDINGHYAQKNNLEDEIISLQEEVDNEYHTCRVNRLNEEIAELESAIENLGLFHGKEKKDIRFVMDKKIKERDSEQQLAAVANAERARIITQKLNELKELDRILNNGDIAIDHSLVDEIRSHELKTVSLGYDMSEVDKLLEDVCYEILAHKDIDSIVHKLHTANFSISVNGQGYDTRQTEEYLASVCKRLTARD